MGSGKVFTTTADGGVAAVDATTGAVAWSITLPAVSASPVLAGGRVLLAGGDGRRLESVDPGGVIASSIPAGSVIGCVVYPATSLDEPGVVRHVEGTRFSLAELDGSRSERLRAIAGALAGAGLRAPNQARSSGKGWRLPIS